MKIKPSTEHKTHHIRAHSLNSLRNVQSVILKSMHEQIKYKVHLCVYMRHIIMGRLRNNRNKKNLFAVGENEKSGKIFFFNEMSHNHH